MRFAAVVLALVFALAPLDGRAANAPYVVPVIISLTGPLALIGIAQRISLNTLAETVNAEGGIDQRPLQFDYMDDGSSTAASVQIASRLISQKAPLILGPSSTATCRAVAPLVTSGPVNYCMSTAGPIAKGGFSFDGGFTTFDSARLILNYCRQRGWRRLAILTPIDSTGQDGEQSADAALALPESRGMTVVAREHFNPADISIAAQIARIEAAKPDVLYAWTTGAPLGTVLHAVQYAGYDIPVVTASGNLRYNAMEQFGDLAPKAGLYFPAQRFFAAESLHGAARVAVDRFIKAFADEHIRPDAVIGTEWDVGVVVVDALRHLGPDATADQLRRYIDQIHGLEGATATFDFIKTPQRGISSETLIVARWDPTAKTFIAVTGPGGTRL